MAGRNLGEAFVVIYPEASQFLTDLTAKVTAAIKSFKAPAVTVPVNADTGPALAQMQLLATRMKAMADTLATLRVNADTKAAQAAIATVEARLIALGKQMSNLIMKADTSQIDAKIAAEIANLQSLKRQASNLQLDLNDAQAEAKIALLKKQIQDTNNALEDMTGDININAAEAKVKALEAELRLLQSTASDMELQARTAAFDAAIAASEAKIAALRQQAADVQIGGDPAKIAAMTAQVLGLEAATEKLTASLGDAEGSTGRWAAALGLLTGRVGALNIGWTATIGGIAGWHIVLDAAIEATIIAIGVTAALGAAFAGVYPSIDELGYHTKAALDVMTAFNVDAGKLGGTLDSLQKSLAPQVIEAFGGALNLLNNQTGAIYRTAHEVVDMFDIWIAKLDLWANGQKTLSGFMQAGVGYLEQLGKAAALFGQAIDNLLTKDPGIAHYLLDLIQGLAGVLDWFSKLPAPIVEATLMIHGFYLWGSVLVGILGPMVSGIVKFVSAAIDLGKIALGMTALTESATGLQKAFALLFAETPYGWLILAAAGMAAMAYETTQASSATQQFLDKQTALLNAMSASQQITGGFAQQIGSIRTQMAGTTAAFELSQWHGLSGILQESGDKAAYAGHELSQVVQGSTLHELGAVADIIHGVFAPGFAAAGAAALQAQTDIGKLNDQINQLVGTSRTMYAELGSLIFGTNALKLGTMSYTSALALMDMAGVKAGQSVALMNQEISNLVAGYNEIGAGSTQLQASINAVTFQTELQDSKVTELNSAWDAFFKMVSGGSSDFLTFAQQVNGMNETFSGSSNAAQTLTVSNGRVSDSFRAAAAAASGGKVSMTGLNDASLAAQQTLLQTASAANTQLDSLQALSAAAGAGQHGMDLMQQATKDMLSTMLPAAAGSQQMTTVLYALAQRGGYAGADSFQALSHWIDTNSGSVKGATPGLANLQGIVTELTVKAGNLTTDVKNLSVALGQTLTQAEATATLAASGAQKGMVDFANAVLNGHKNVQQLEPSALELGNELVKLTGNTADAKQQFLVFAQGALHISSQEANELWDEIANKLTPAVQDSGTKGATPAQKAFEAFAGASGGTGLGLTKKKAEDLWGELKTNLTGVLGDLTNKDAPAAQKAFEQLAGQSGKNGMGLTKTLADQLWQYLHGNMTQILEALTGQTVPNTQKAFELWAGKDGRSGLGLTKAQADLLWQETLPSLTKAIDNLPAGKAISITMKGTGSYTIQDISASINSSAANAGRTSIPGSVAGRLAGGGLISAGTTPSADDVPLWASRGEYVVKAASVAKYGQHMLDAVNAGHFAEGGLVGRYAAGGLVTPPPYTGNLTPASIQGMYDDFSNQFSSAMVNAMKGALTASKQAAQAVLGSPVSFSGVAGVTQWESDVSKVLSMLGLPQADLPTVMAQMVTESGGNPNAINLTDINAQQGDPSRGLMQVIGSTFAAYRSPSLSANIYDPMANIYAGLNYAIHRYGNPGWLSVLGHGHGYAAGGLIGGAGVTQRAGMPSSVVPARWYDAGGSLMPGYTLAYNGTGQPETVVPAASQTDALLRQLISEVRRNTQATAAQGAQFARGLQGTLTRGYYGR